MKTSHILLFLLFSTSIAFSIWGESLTAKEPAESSLLLQALKDQSVVIELNTHTQRGRNVEGTILGADKEGLLLESDSQRLWIPLDSVLVLRTF